ncbi:MAG: ADP-ribosylglycohydrolase family protein [Candidatus Marinimicrobia bacterium]|nr:ADP-ribosylglycohydrolase family protein [Candidatus Neomarinimicrobiota bacterium]
MKLDQLYLMDHISGALFGLGIGDALGADTEGMHPDSITEKYGYIQDFQRPEQVGTDDTEFTIFYARILSKYGLNVSSETISDCWINDIYHPSQSYKGAGFSEALALQNLLKGLKPPASGQHVHSWSDGLAMCASPFGCVYPGQPEQAAELATTFGQVSHAGEGIFGGKAVAAAVSMALIGASMEEICHSALSVIPSDSWTYFSIQKAIAIGKNSIDGKSAISPLYKTLVSDYYHWADLAPEAVGIAFGFLLAGKGDYEETILAAVNFGRDSDTIAAISGAILGALLGYSGLPENWCQKIQVAPGRCIRSLAGVSLSDTARLLTNMAVLEGNSI